MSVPSSARRGVGVALVVLGASLFIVNSGVSRVALRSGIASFELTSLRVTGTFLTLLVIAALVQRSALRLPRGREIWLVLGLGLFGVGLLQFLYFVALDRLTIGLALLLEFQAPFLVALWAKFVQHAQVTARLWWGLGLAVVGLAAATEVWKGATFDSLGVLAGLGAALCFAAYFLMGETAQESMSSVSVMLWGFAVAAVVFNVVEPVWRIDAPYGEQVSMQGNLDHLTVPLWCVVTSIVVLGTLVPFGVELAALRYIPATVVTAIAMLEPVGAAALGWLWFDEAMGPVAVLGCLAVVAGIWLGQTSRKEPPAEEPVAIT